jgi:signal transduction histidine kinase
VAPLLDDLALNAAKIAEHGRRADRIVRSMLLHARGVSGERRGLDLHALLDEAAAHAVAARTGPAGGDGVGDAPAAPAVERDYDPAVPEVEAIGPALHRALLNLVENAAYAVRARAARGEPGYRPCVRLATRRDGERVRITIADNGDGIADDARARLFEPFYTTKPTGEGTGLGLSIAHDIVRGHGGTLEASGREGEGATFTLTLPLRPVAPGTPAGGGAAPR